MYPRNSSSPPRISLGQVLSISTGAPQTDGVSVVVQKEGDAEAAADGSIDYSPLTGSVLYTPTQEETDCPSFIVTAYKSGGTSPSLNILTTNVGTVGSGERLFEYICEVDGAPASGVKVWISTGSPLSDSNVAAGPLISGDLGKPLLNGSPVDFMLDDDTVYYLWRDSPEFNFADPLQFRYSTSNARWELWDGSSYNEWS